MERFLGELALSGRRLRRVPGLAAIAVLALGLGTGGTVAMLAAVDAAFLHPLPFPLADRIVTLWQSQRVRGQVSVSMPEALDWLREMRSASHLTIFIAGPANVAGDREPEWVTAAHVTSQFFATLGAAPVRGRTFSAEESASGGERTVVVSARLWRRLLGADPRAVGRTLRVDGVSATVIGVLPDWMSFPDGAELWEPLNTADATSRSAHNYRVVARLAPRVSVRQAQAEMTEIAARHARAYPDTNAGLGVEVVPLRRELVGRTGTTFAVLLGAVCLVLLIACADVMNLLLARVIAQRNEVHLRLALGARRWALLRPWLFESLMLAFLGGVLGFALAAAGIRAIDYLAPPGVLPPDGLLIDARLIPATLVVSLLSGTLCSLAPLVQIRHGDLQQSLAGGRSLVGGGRRAMSLLILGEVALAFVLLVGSCLLIESVRRLSEVDLGFSPGPVAVLQFNFGGPAGSPYSDPEWRTRFLSQLADRAASLAGVRSVGLVSQYPLSGKSYHGTLESTAIEGAYDTATPDAHYRLIGGDYFQTLGIPLLRGRTFGRDDSAASPLVAIVNHRLAHLLGNCLGRQVRMPGMDGVKSWATVVGIVGDVHHLGAEREPVPEIYFPYLQRPRRTWEMSLLARVSGPLQDIRAVLGEVTRSIDPTLPIRFETLAGRSKELLAPARFRALLLAGFSTMALLLATVGIFGVVSYNAGRRSREIGLRMALGADRRSVERLLLRSGLAPVGGGLLAGAATALLLARFLVGFLFGVKADDVITLTMSALVLLGAAFAGTYLPARRATRLDPASVLRAE